MSFLQTPVNCRTAETHRPFFIQSTILLSQHVKAVGEDVMDLDQGCGWRGECNAGICAVWSVRQVENYRGFGMFCRCQPRIAAKEHRFEGVVEIEHCRWWRNDGKRYVRSVRLAISTIDISTIVPKIRGRIFIVVPSNDERWLQERFRRKGLANMNKQPQRYSCGMSYWRSQKVLRALLGRRMLLYPFWRYLIF